MAIPPGSQFSRALAGRTRVQPLCGFPALSVSRSAGEARVTTLRDALSPLPDTALVPVSWVRSLLDAEPAVPVDTPDLTVAAFARLMGRSPATVRGWCERGVIVGAFKLPGARRRAAWRIPAASVQAFRLRGNTPGLVVSTEAPAGDITAWRHVRRRGKR